LGDHALDTLNIRVDGVPLIAANGDGERHIADLGLGLLRLLLGADVLGGPPGAGRRLARAAYLPPLLIACHRQEY
jgi:hypothetical protein